MHCRSTVRKAATPHFELLKNRLFCATSMCSSSSEKAARWMRPRRCAVETRVARESQWKQEWTEGISGNKSALRESVAAI